MKEINFYVITDGRRRIDSSLLQFTRLHEVVLEKVPGIFLKSFEELKEKPSLQEAYLRLGRHITLAEIGCALAHRGVYSRILIEDAEWSVIFEDDAIVTDFSLLQSQIRAIQFSNVRNPSIFLFFHKIPLKNDRKKSQLFRKANSVPSYALAYALNKAAAQALLEAQSKIFSIADWPVCTHQVKFYLASNLGINHGSEIKEVQSQIGSANRGSVVGVSKFRWFIGYHFLRLRVFSPYLLHRHICFVWLPRIFKKS
jgi:GR25 family glycosyltransferase involved in LPS biosynthesis